MVLLVKFLKYHNQCLTASRASDMTPFYGCVSSSALMVVHDFFIPITYHLEGALNSHAVYHINDQIPLSLQHSWGSSSHTRL